LTVQWVNSKIVQLLNNYFSNMNDSQDLLNLMRVIKKKPELSQRELAKDLGFSLGKLNYCLKALKNKGLVKIRNFRKKPEKINNIKYILTPKGISERTKLTINFMARKMEEYDELKRELNKSNLNKN
jgi:EPS-associated MarR family transcriptional regulator